MLLITLIALAIVAFLVMDLAISTRPPHTGDDWMEGPLRPGRMPR